MKQAIMAVILVCGAVVLGAQDSGLTLVNGEGVWLYVAVDPALDSAAEEARTFTVLTRLRFSALAPGAAQTRLDIGPGRHSIIGFWTSGNSSEYGVFRLILSLEAGQPSTFTLKKTGALAALEKKTYDVTFTLPATPIVIDNLYADWEVYPAIAVFPPSLQPAQFAYQTADGVRNLPIRNSAYWGKGGTQLLVMKGLVNGETLSLYFTSSSVFLSGLSIYFYLFDDRKTQELNTYTIELPMNETATGGDILLWTRGVKEPIMIGAFTSAGASLEGAVNLGLLPQQLRRDLLKKYSFDLKTGFHERGQGFYEEFFFTSRLWSDLSVRP